MTTNCKWRCGDCGRPIWRGRPGDDDAPFVLSACGRWLRVPPLTSAGRPPVAVCRTVGGLRPAEDGIYPMPRLPDRPENPIAEEIQMALLRSLRHAAATMDHPVTATTIKEALVQLAAPPDYTTRIKVERDPDDPNWVVVTYPTHIETFFVDDNL